MKIIDAYWDKENLGVATTEIVSSANDSIKELKSTLGDIKSPYTVVKIPSGCTEQLLSVQEMGFSVIEVSFNYESKLSKIKLPTLYERFMPDVMLEPATEELKERALNEVLSGSIFSTDRIALDPAFSKELSGKRYYNWCRKALEGGAEMVIAYYKGIPAAFNISQKSSVKGNMSVGLLGGNLQGAPNGLGFLLVACEAECCKRLGLSICEGTTSSNNFSSLRLHMECGFVITSSNYVLVRHLNV